MKKITGIILCLVFGMSLIGCNVQPRMGAGNAVLATGGEHQLLLRDYLYFLGSLRAQNEQMLHQFFGLTFEDFEAYWGEVVDEETGRTIFEDLKEAALEQAKEVMIFHRLAVQHGYTYDREEIAMIRDNIQQTVFMMNSPSITGERLFYEINYVTATEAIESRRILSAVDNFRLSIHERIDVTDASARAFYDDPENSEMIEGIRIATVAHILIMFDEEVYGPEGREETMEKAEEILARIRGGESFASLVVEYSEDPGSVENDGQYQVTRSTNFVPEFLDWTFEAEVGDLGIVETFHGIHIMNLVAIEGFEDMQVERETHEGPVPALSDMVRGHLFALEIERLLNENAVNWTVNTELFDSIAYDVYARQQRR